MNEKRHKTDYVLLQCPCPPWSLPWLILTSESPSYLIIYYMKIYSLTIESKGTAFVFSSVLDLATTPLLFWAQSHIQQIKVAGRDKSNLKLKESSQNAHWPSVKWKSISHSTKHKLGTACMLCHFFQGLCSCGSWQMMHKYLKNHSIIQKKLVSPSVQFF